MPPTAGGRGLQWSSLAPLGPRRAPRAATEGTGDAAGAGPKPASPASLRARSLPAGRQLVAAEEGAEVGGQIVLPRGRGRRRRPARLPHTCVCVGERGRPRENVCATGSVFARPRAREPGARALGPGRDGGSRARLCAPSWQRRDSRAAAAAAAAAASRPARAAAVLRGERAGGPARWRLRAERGTRRVERGEEGGREGGRGPQTRGGKAGSAGRSGGSWRRRSPLP